MNIFFMRTVMLIYVFVLILPLLIISPNMSFAQSESPGTFTYSNVDSSNSDKRIVPRCEGDKCDFCDFGELIQNIVNMSIFLATLVAASLFAWAGWRYLTSGGDTGKIKAAHSIFVNVAAGFVLILGAWLIVDTLMKTLTNGKFGPWNEICSDSASSTLTNG